jgi:hypothetical protein
VRLTVGTTASQVSSRGLMSTLKDKLAGLNPKVLAKTVLKKMEGYLSEDEQVKNARKGE